MASILRLSIWALFILGVPSFLVLQGSFTPVIRIAGATTLLALLSVLLFTGKPKQDSIAAISKLQTKTAVVNSEQKYDNEPTKIEATPTSEKGSEVKEVTLNNTEDQDFQVIEPSPAPSSKVAEKYAVISDAQIEFEDQVERYVEDRRERRSEIKERIERERRKALAPMRARRLREWAQQEDGEGLHDLIETTQHGLTIIEYDTSSKNKKNKGSTYIRLDEDRILKISRDITFQSTKNPGQNSEMVESQPSDRVNDNPGNPPAPPEGMPPPPPPPEM